MNNFLPLRNYASDLVRTLVQVFFFVDVYPTDTDSHFYTPVEDGSYYVVPSVRPSARPLTFMPAPYLLKPLNDYFENWVKYSP